MDSGNLLIDPLTQKPVHLINYKVFTNLFHNIGIEDIVFKTENLKKLSMAHYISFNTLNANDKILVFQIEQIVFEGKVLEKPILGLCLKNFNSAFESDIILHNEFATI